MKRLISLILVTVMMYLLTGCDLKPKQPEQYTFPDAGYAVNATDMAVVGDKIYYISDEKVYEAGTDEPIFTEFPAQFLSSNGKELAVYGNGQVKLGEKTCTIPQTELTSLVYIGDTVCWSYLQGDMPQIGFYNTKNDDSISITPLAGMDCRVLPYREGSILIRCYDVSGEMYTYEFDTVSMKPGKFMTEDIFLTAACTGDTFVMLRQSGRVELHHLSDGTIEKRNPCTEMAEGVKKLLFSGDSAIFLSEEGTIYIRNAYCTPIEPGNTVVILQDKDGGYFGEHILQQMNEALKEQGIEVVVNEYSADQIRLKQLAGDDDYDLYVTDGYSIVLDYPIYEPLNDYAAVTDRFDLMYDEIREICTFNGNIYGILLDLQVQNSLWEYNAELFEELGMALPDPSWTLNDYYEMAVEIRSKGHYISSRVNLSLSDYLHMFGDMYETKSLTDDGSILRNYLEIMKKLQKEGLLYNKETAEEGAKTLFGFSTAPFRIRHNNPDMPPELTFYDVWYPVTFDRRMPDMTIMAFLQMNQNSLNKEKAALVIAECMKPAYNEEYRRDAVFYKETGEAIRSVSDKAEENFQIYLNVLANSRPWYIHETDITQFMNDEAKKYYNDEQDLELTVEKIYARAKMIFEE